MLKFSKSKFKVFEDLATARYLDEMLSYFRSEHGNLTSSLSDEIIKRDVLNSLRFCNKIGVSDDHTVMRLAIISVLIDRDYYDRKEIKNLIMESPLSSEKKLAIFCDQMQFLMSDIAAGRRE